MKLKINKAIEMQLKKSYAIESGHSEDVFEIDCGEGINTVSYSNKAVEAFNALEFDMIRGYPHSIALKDNIVDYWKDFIKLDTDRICLADGSIHVIYLLNRLFIEKGDKVLGYSPQFSEYETDIKMHGAIYDYVLLKKEDNFKFNEREFIKKINSEYKVIYIDNPNNPTGQIIPLSSIENIVKEAAKYDIAVMVDEAYGEYMPKENSAVKLLNNYDNVIALKTFSKGFGLAGLRAGYAVLPEQLVSPIKKISTPYEVSEISRSIAANLLDDVQFIEELKEKTKYIKNQLLVPWKNLNIAETSDTVSIMTVEHKNKDIDLQQEFAKLKIRVISGSDFTGLDKNFIRFRMPEEKELPEVIKAFQIIDNIE
ncbi:TPA: histidinol-phosphate transaminase [Clostridioides difficile]